MSSTDAPLAELGGRMGAMASDWRAHVRVGRFVIGQDSRWWTNHDSDCGATNSATPVFDSLIAGTNGDVFAIMIR
ncbi:hypothetical protein ACIREO_28570 [Streptomyces sp. NPDC102441]|uniref:hypothetical protein n=1 Tax=Streptomyces sp. NPDC102441 TaxID=3366176 RepID=UPI0038301A9E